jgi:hypothetical protein
MTMCLTERGEPRTIRVGGAPARGRQDEGNVALWFEDPDSVEAFYFILSPADALELVEKLAAAIEVSS